MPEINNILQNDFARHKYIPFPKIVLAVRISHEPYFLIEFLVTLGQDVEHFRVPLDYLHDTFAV